MKIRFLTILAVSLSIFSILASTTAKDAPKLIFKKGDGAKYKMTSQGGGSAELSIYFSESSLGRLGVEYFMAAGAAFAPVKLWQQYIMERPKGMPIKIVEGYIYAEDLKAAEKLDSSYLKGYDGVQVNDFLFKERSEIVKDKIADELIETPAGNTICSHYRKTQNGQVVDFWISEEAGPIGLVKLVSKNEKKSDQNYTLELLSLLVNVAPTIDPQKAVSLTEKGRALMPIPMTK